MSFFVEKFLNEVKRRQIVKPLAAYVGLSWLILQVVGTFADLIEIHPLIGPGVLLFLVCGLPVVAYLSWHFEFSDGSFSRTPTLRRDASEEVEPFGLVNWFALLFIATLCGFIGFQYFDEIRSQQLAEGEGLATVKQVESIAVLPFNDQSPEKDQSYLAVGLAEEITSLLGRAEGFRVTASRSTQILADNGLTPTDIGRRLGVQAVLTGSVRAVGSRLKIRVELLDTENGRALWTESFLRELADIFEVESEISRAVVNLLQDQYLEAGAFDAVATTKSTDAYVMYLRGREEYRKQTTESMKEARKLFEQTVALDPEYAKAYVALADTLAALSEGADGFGVLKAEIAAKLAEDNLNKAIVRQPDIAEIYAVMGVVNLLRRNFDDSLGNFDKAVELNPSLAIAYMWKSIALNELGRFDEAIDVQKVAQSLDPLFMTSTYNLGLMLSARGRYEEAELIFRQLQADFPESPFPFQGLAEIAFSRGDFVGAIREGQSALQRSPDNVEMAQALVGPMLQLGLTDLVKAKEGDPIWNEAVSFYEASILIFEKKFDALFELMDFQLEAHPDDYWIVFEAGWYHAMFGDSARGVELIRDGVGSMNDIEKFGMPYCSPAIESAWAHRELAELQAYEEILTNCESLLDEQRASALSFFELDYLAARIHALRGRRSEALGALSDAIQRGFREWWAPHDPLMESLAEEPEYKRLMQQITDDLARQASAARDLAI